MKFLLWGGQTGWIGQMLYRMMKDVVATQVAMQDRDKVENLLDDIKPDRVIIAAGLTGRPNVDWCEDRRKEVIQTNVVGILTIVDECCKRNIHVTYLGTGCIYQYDIDHQIGGQGFKETDQPNFSGSYYSKTKSMVEELLKAYENVLILRVRMPISDDLHPRNFITKILNYEKIVNVPNSMTILSDLLPILIDMSINTKTGIYNFINPGAVSHNEIMEMYKEIVDPNHTWKNFSLDEQSKILKAGRSNCELDCSKLLAEYPNIPLAKDSIRKIMNTW